MNNQIVIRRPAGVSKLAVSQELIPSMIRRNSALPETRKLALQMIQEAGAPEHDRYQEFLAIANGLKKRVRFLRDPHRIESISDLGDTLEFGAGDCDDYTVALGSLLAAAGFPVRVRIVGRDRLSHVYPEALVNGSWLPADLARKSGWFNRKKYPKMKIVELEEALSGVPWAGVAGDLGADDWDEDDELGSWLSSGFKTAKKSVKKVVKGIKTTARSVKKRLAKSDIGKTMASVKESLARSDIGKTMESVGRSDIGKIAQTVLPGDIGKIATMLPGGAGLVAGVLLSKRAVQKKLKQYPIKQEEQETAPMALVGYSPTTGQPIYSPTAYAPAAKTKSSLAVPLALGGLVLLFLWER